MGLGDEGFLAGSMDEASIAINLNFKACLHVCLAVARCLYVTFTSRSRPSGLSNGDTLSILDVTVL